MRPATVTNSCLRTVVLVLFFGTFTSHSTTATSNGTQCVLSPTNNARDALQSIVSLQPSLIQLRLSFRDINGSHNGKTKPENKQQKEKKSEVISRLERDLGLFRPWLWQRSTSRQGRSLLMLSDNFDVLSLKLLALRVQTLDVTLTSSPPGCLGNMTSEGIKDLVLVLLLNDFKIDGEVKGGGSLSPDEHICYRQIRSSDRNSKIAKFVHVCCRYDVLDPTVTPQGEGQGEGQGSDLVCSDVKRDSWITLLLTAVMVIKVLVVLFSPNLLPESLYREKFSKVKYVYTIPEEKKVTLRMLKTKTPENYPSKENVVRPSKHVHMSRLMELVNSWQEDWVYDVTVTQALLGVKARKVLGENEVPVGFMKIIYNNLFLCRLRRLSALASCCKADILGLLNPGFKLPTWFKCSRLFARVLLLALLILPWLIRVMVYYDHERPVMQARKEAAARAGLEHPFLAGNFTIYWTPVHVLFVVCYVMLAVDSLVFGVLSRAVRDKMKLVIRRCLRDMKERSKMSVLGWATTVIVFPCTRCGLLGLLFLPVWLVLVLPIILPVLAFYIFPAVNLSLRLVFHVFLFICPNRCMRGIQNIWQRVFGRAAETIEADMHRQSNLDEKIDMKNEMSRCELPFQVVVVLVCLVSFWSLTFLAMELLSFVVEVAVYTFIGIIVTADVTSRYLTVVVMLLLYAHGSFSDVHKKYMKYHRDVHKQVISLNREGIDKVARMAESAQENTAFYMHGKMGPDATKPPVTFTVHKGKLRWQTSSIVLFLDNKDSPYTTEKFFFETIDLDYHGCPGELYVNYLDALWTFGKLVIFLFFVFIVVMAFGSAHEVSSTNQLLATVAGGFVPLMFRFVFTGSSGADGIDDKSIQWQTSFHKAINEYEQHWPVFDIEPAAPVRRNTAAETEPDVLMVDETSLKNPPSPERNTNNGATGRTPASPLASENRPLHSPSSPTSPLPPPTGVPPSSFGGSEKAESIDWDDTRIDVIFDLSDPRKRGKGQAGSETMNAYEDGRNEEGDYYEEEDEEQE